MIKVIPPAEYLAADQPLRGQNARSYFIRLGLRRPDTYQAVYGDYGPEGALRGLLCLRRSGTVQFVALGEPDVEALKGLLETFSWTQLIAPESSGIHLERAGAFSTTELRACIARLESLRPGHREETAPMTPADLTEVVGLYDRVFDQHMSLGQMQEKLAAARGRGVVIRRGGRIVSMAQTELEEDDSALVVGVATDPAFQRHGLAEGCVRSLCETLLTEGRIPWLQYDNPDAGKLYTRLGFVPADRILFGWK